MVCKKMLAVSLLILISTSGRALGDESDYFNKIVEKAMEHIQTHGEWLRTNVTEILNKFMPEKAEETTATMQSIVAEAKSLDSIEAMIAKVQEKVSSLTKDLEKEEGEKSLLAKMWQTLKSNFGETTSQVYSARTNQNSPFSTHLTVLFNKVDSKKTFVAYLTNVLTGRTSVQQVLKDGRERFETAQQSVQRTLSEFINFMKTIYTKLNGPEKDLQNELQNMTLDNVLAMGKKLAEKTQESSPFKMLLEKVTSLWTLLSNEVGDMKSIMDDKEAVSKKINNLKEIAKEKAPQSVKDIIAEYDKADEEDKNFLNLISIATGRSVEDIMKAPQYIYEFFKKLQ